jgi:transcriptional regulator with XRE-family HTH domain
LTLVNLIRIFSNMGTRKVELGETGHTVKAQVRRLREQRKLSLQALSDRMVEVGRPILPSGLSKIESGDRRVDVDDLVALAEAMWATPDDLLTAPDAPPKAVDQVETMLRVAAELEAAARVQTGYLGVRPVGTATVQVTDVAGLTDAAAVTTNPRDTDE